MPEHEHKELVLSGTSPKLILKEAIEASRSLKSLLSRKAKPVIIGGQQYLQFEDWATLGQFFKITARVTSTTYISRTVDNQSIWGFESTAEAIHIPTGQVVSSATAECMSDESNWKDKPSFQLRSMAQTRACAKALRNCLSWVAVLAGYQPTPAEEVVAGPVKEAPEKTSSTTVEDYKMENMWDLFHACRDKYNLSPTEVLRYLGVKNVREIADFWVAWEDIKMKMRDKTLPG